MKLRYLCLAAGFLAAMGVSAASAQALFADKRVITSHAARSMVDACLDFAARNDFTLLAIAVVDPTGTLLSFQAMEGATETAVTTAIAKAKTAARWRRSTEDLFARVNGQVNRAPEWLGDFPQPGGFPIIIGGQLVGAIGGGGGGGGGDQDDQCALAAVAAVFGDSADTGRVE